MKRLCVLSDGTWQTPESKETTNILKLALYIQRQDDNGTEQVIFYDKGIGSEGDANDRMMGGLMGAGIDINIRQLYTFLAVNYIPGDEIYLFGFSRGAYTVRSLAGYMHTAGLVTHSEIEYVHEGYQMYRRKVSSTSKEAVNFRAKHGPQVPITLLACFDTVGALGIPTNLDWMKVSKHMFEFHDTKLNDQILNAIHMLSIDEDRDAFAPTFMDPNDAAKPEQLTQKFFWGHHSGIGGGDTKEVICAAITLRFLIQEMRKRGLPLKIVADPAIIALAEEQETRIARGGFDIFSFVTKMVAGAGARRVPNVTWLHDSAVHHYQAVKSWRPSSLKHVEEDILTLKL